MRPFGSPLVKLIPDALIIKYFGKMSTRSGVLISATARDYMDMPALPYLFKDRMIGQLGYVMHRAVVIYIIIIVPPGVLGKIIDATHGNYTIDNIGAF